MSAASFGILSCCGLYLNLQISEDFRLLFGHPDETAYATAINQVKRTRSVIGGDVTPYDPSSAEFQLEQVSGVYQNWLSY